MYAFFFFFGAGVLLFVLRKRIGRRHESYRGFPPFRFREIPAPGLVVGRRLGGVRGPLVFVRRAHLSLRRLGARLSLRRFGDARGVLLLVRRGVPDAPRVRPLQTRLATQPESVVVDAVHAARAPDDFV